MPARQLGKELGADNSGQEPHLHETRFPICCFFPYGVMGTWLAECAKPYCPMVAIAGKLLTALSQTPG
jgi:hypothetical protein